MLGHERNVQSCSRELASYKCGCVHFYWSPALTDLGGQESLILVSSVLVAAKDFQKALAAGEMREKQDLRCPIKEAAYTAHAGSVYSVDCSPYQVSSPAEGAKLPNIAKDPYTLEPWLPIPLKLIGLLPVCK